MNFISIDIQQNMELKDLEKKNKINNRIYIESK